MIVWNQKCSEKGKMAEMFTNLPSIGNLVGTVVYAGRGRLKQENLETPAA